MATIAFILSHQSHQNATFKLAKILSEANHKIVYSGPKTGIDGHDLRENIESQGFEFSELRLFKTVKNDELVFKSYVESLINQKPFKTFVKQAKPDLILLDIHYSIFTIPFWNLGPSLGLISTELYTGQTKFNVPLSYSAFPKSNATKTNSAAWNAYYNQRINTGNILTLAELVAKHHNFPFKKLIDTHRCLVPFSFKISELVLWPEKFDSKNSGNSRIKHMGGLVDIERTESQSNRYKTSQYKHNIYVALGTRNVINAEHKKRLLHFLISIFKEMPEVGVVISSNWKLPQSPNVKVLTSSPQISILKKCDLMITHAGGNSVKECIMLGVPMLCFPSDNDQFGLSARVEYFKIGLTSRIDNYTKEEITHKINELLTNPIFKSNIAKQKKVFLTENESIKANRVVNTLLSIGTKV